MSKVIVVGGGAAGMMAAYGAGLCGHSVTLLEKNEKLGKKIYITGKGRCNLTSACETAEFFGHVVTNPRFLYSAVYGFDNTQVMQFFEENGCPLKIERGERVFPVSDHASDVTDTLVRFIRRNGGKILFHTEIKSLIIRDGRAAGVRCADGKSISADAVIVCTGGRSYPTTGSTGDGWRFAKEAGHTVREARPSLVPLVTKEDWCRQLQGLALKNVALTVKPTESDKAQEIDSGKASADSGKDAATGSGKGHGKGKKKTSVKAKMKSKSSNARGYSVVHSYSYTKNRYDAQYDVTDVISYHKYYLKKPNGKKVFLMTRGVIVDTYY